jgi:LEA14-like dessication related protein
MKPHAVSHAIRAGLVLCLVVLTACTGLLGSAVREPDVDVVGAELTHADLNGAEVLFEFEVDNPNGIALVLDGLAYRLRLNDEPLLNGNQDRRTEIAARTGSRVDLPITLRYSDVVRALETLNDREDPTYELQADFRFAVPVIGSLTVPVTKRGRLSLDRLLRLRLGK